MNLTVFSDVDNVHSSGCVDTDDISVVRFIRDHEHWTRDQVFSVLVIDNERFDRCLARARLFPLSESSVREYIRQNPTCGAADLLAQFSLSRSEYEASYQNKFMSMNYPV